MLLPLEDMASTTISVRKVVESYVDAPPVIIDVVDKDDDIIDEEDPIPHDLADSDDEDFVNLDIDDGVNVLMCPKVIRLCDSGGDDRPLLYQVPRCRVLLRQPEGAPGKPNLVWELPLHYPSWRQMPPERKAGVVAKIGTQFDLRPHMESDRWPQIYAGIQQHLQKIYNGKKAALKERHWDPDEDGHFMNWERLRADMETSATREYLSLIHTFFLTHTVGGVFLNPEDKALYMLNQLESQPEYGGGSGSGGCGDDEPGDDEDGDEDEDDS
ncbi:hypothetical protein Tco_0543188 [Tanacetum coccineum]